MTTPAETSPPADPPDPHQHRRLIAALAVTQLIGWGTLFYPVSILGRPIGAELGLPREIIFSGISLMLIASAVLAPRMGRSFDREGTRRAMAAGSAVACASLALLALAGNAWVYLGAWVLAGSAMAMCLGNATFTTLTQVAGPGARRAITTLTFFTGVSGTISWPATSFLEAEIGWRATLALYAALNLLVALPLHALVLPSAASHRARLAAGPLVLPGEGVVAPARRRLAFVLLAIALSAHGTVGWGIALHFIRLFQDLGLPGPTAVAVASLAGVMAITGRGLEFVSGGRHSPIVTGLVSAWCQPVAFVAILLLPVSTASAVVFIVFYGLSSGLMTIAKSTVPLWLFGREAYGANVGRLTLPQNAAFAAAPIVFAALLERIGPFDALAFGFVMAAIAAGTMTALALLAQRAR